MDCSNEKQPIYYMESKCWVCLHNIDSLNIDSWVNMCWTVSRYINHGVCNQESCLNKVFDLYINHHVTPAENQKELQEIEHFSKTGTYPDSIFKHIMLFKIEKKFDPKIFLALALYAITPCMLEAFTPGQLIKHCVILLTQNTQHWEFFNLTKCNRNLFFRAGFVDDQPLKIDLDPCNILPRFFKDQKIRLKDMKFLTRVSVLPELCKNHTGRTMEMSPERINNVINVFSP